MGGKDSPVWDSLKAELFPAHSKPAGTGQTSGARGISIGSGRKSVPRSAGQALGDRPLDVIEGATGDLPHLPDPLAGDLRKSLVQRRSQAVGPPDQVRGLKAHGLLGKELGKEVRQRLDDERGQDGVLRTG
jgi:hypothetical protein